MRWRSACLWWLNPDHGRNLQALTYPNPNRIRQLACYTLFQRQINLTHTAPTPTTSPPINLPRAQEELQQAFHVYEDALVHNKVDVLDALFWNSPHTLRYGAKENLNGYDDIKAFRAARPGAGLNRDILDCHIVTFGDSMVW